MRLAGSKQVVVLTIPQAELLLLFLVPEFRSLLGQFPFLIKAQFAAEPCQLFIHKAMVPFVLDTQSNFASMVRLRESLKQLPPLKGKMR